MSLSHLSRERNFQIPNIKSSFASLSPEEIVTHIAISKYGNFRLTDAIRPSYDLRIVPEEAYCYRLCRIKSTGKEFPILIGTASREKLLNLFFDLISMLGNLVDVVLESSHFRRSGHTDYVREGIDLPVLKSLLWEYEDILLNDGYLGIAVLDPVLQAEVRFDEHKTVSIFGKNLSRFESVFRTYGIERKESLHFLAEDEHIHSSDPAFRSRFERLCAQIGTEFNFTV